MRTLGLRQGAHRRDACRGVALLLTLGILLLLTLLALSFSSSQLTENEAAKNFYYAAKAEEIALGGLETAVAALRKDAEGDPEDVRHPGGEVVTSDDLFERWAIYYKGHNGFACEENAKENEAVDLSDYDEFQGDVDRNGKLKVPMSGRDPWDTERKNQLDSRWILVTYKDPVTNDERRVGRFAVCIEDENAKVNINTAGNPDPMDKRNTQWLHRQDMGFTTAEVNLGGFFDSLGDLFANTMHGFDHFPYDRYPYNVGLQTAADVVAYRYGARTGMDQLAPGQRNDDDNAGPHGRVEANQGENGIDDDGDGLIDETGEQVDEPLEFAPYEPLEIQPPGRLLTIENPRTGVTGVMGDDTAYLTTSQIRMGGAIRDLPDSIGPYPKNAIYRSVLPFITVYSEDLNRFSNLDAGQSVSSSDKIEWYIRENIGRWLYEGSSNPADGVDEVYKSLRWMHNKNIAFVSTSDDLLKQIAVNLYDFIDPDWFPTEYGDYVGLEPTVYINEVFPAPAPVPGSVVGIEGWVLDWGEWIELWNPYAVALDVKDYSVTVSSGSQQTIASMSNVSSTIMRPGEFFVIGDKSGYFQNTGGQGPQGEQANLSNRPDGCDAYANLNLDGQAMRLELRDERSRVRVVERNETVPVRESNEQFATGSYSTQKEDPRMASWVPNQAPTKRYWNPGQQARIETFYLPGVRARARDPQWNPADAPLLSHAGALHTIGELGMVHRGEAWRTLNFTGEQQPGYTDSDSENDGRLLDILTLPYPYRNTGLRDEPDILGDRDLPPPKVVPGRININTASPQVLMGLNWRPVIAQLRSEGFQAAAAFNWLLMDHIIDRRGRTPSDDTGPYRNLADLAQDVARWMDAKFPGASESAKEAFIRYNSNLITTRSNVFKVTVLAQAFDRKENIAAERKLDAVIDRGYTPPLQGRTLLRDGEKSWSRQEQARFEIARTLYFRWVTED